MPAVIPSSRVVLAPLAGGPSTPQLAAAVCDAGGLGFLGAGYLTGAALSEQIRETRALTNERLGVNLFYLTPVEVDDGAVARYAAELEPDARRFGVDLGEPRFDDDAYASKLDTVLEERVEVVSFTFGCPPRGDFDRLHAGGTEAWATVTSVDEARRAAAAGADALVVQGCEAGGHRGSWVDDDAPGLPLLDLLRAVAATVELPLIATGGIGDRATASRLLRSGARALQAGSAFLLCPEAGTGAAQRDALARGGETAFTRAFTGRRARGIVNDFMEAHPDAPSAYPHVHHMTAPLRAAARAAGDAQAFNLWAGTAVGQARPLSARDVVAALSPV